MLNSSQRRHNTIYYIYVRQKAKEEPA